MTTEAVQAGVGTAHLSPELTDDDKYTIHGVALGAGDVTVGSSGIKKKWPATELKEAANTLEGQPLVRDHENNTDGTVGTVTKAHYRDGVGIIYEAELASHYEELAQDIGSGLLEVSPRVYHAPVDELEEDDDTGALVVEDIRFDNLSVVSQGASPSNSVKMGEATAMAQGPEGGAVAVMEQGAPRMDAAELEEAFEDDEVEDETEDEELGHVYDIGDLIEWGDENLGSITGVMIEDGVHKYQVKVLETTENGVEPTDETTTVVAHNARIGPHVPSSDLDVDSDEHSEGEQQDEESEELAASWHTPNWDGLDEEREWSEPNMEDFDTDDMSEISDHFFVSKTGEFPPENYEDLALPTVFPDGDLSLDGLDSVHQMAGQTDGISDEMASKIQSKANELAEEHFDQEVAGEEMQDGDEDEVDEEMEEDDDTDETGVQFEIATLQGDDPETASTDGIAALEITTDD